jgi:hypothetical protein
MSLGLPCCVANRCDSQTGLLEFGTKVPSRRNFIKLLSSIPLTTQIFAQKMFAQEKPGGSSVAQQQSLSADPYPGSPVGVALPGQRWLVHDRNRPQVRKVEPGLPIPELRPPSDAIVLFDGADLSHWGTIDRSGEITEPKWKIENGYVELVPRAGSLITKQAFGDCQLHLEWMTPPGADAAHKGQMRGNSGVVMMKRYEIQILSSFDNPNYADGSAGALYGLYPPLVNPCRPEGEWNSYDLVFKAPKFADQSLAKAASVTLFFNNLIVHDHVELLGTTSVEPIAKYQPHPMEDPLMLQGHAGPVRYRNIWIRRLQDYDG